MRIQRLHEISDADVIAEGIEPETDESNLTAKHGQLPPCRPQWIGWDVWSCGITEVAPGHGVMERKFRNLGHRIQQLPAKTLTILSTRGAFS